MAWGNLTILVITSTDKTWLMKESIIAIVARYQKEANKNRGSYI